MTLRILAIGWAVFLLYAYPGYIDTAAADALLDARAAAFGDWSSPVLARVWWVLHLFVGGPPSMLLLQSLLFLGGAFALLRRHVPERTAAIAASGILVFPPILGVEGVICAPSVFAGFALAGTALVTSARARRKIGGLVLLLLACDFHPAAPFAVFPLVVLGLVWRPGLPPVRRYGIALVAFGAVLGGSVLLERSIVELRSYRKEVTLARQDLRAIDKALGQPPAPALALDVDREQHAIIAARHAAIAEHPGAYVRYRLRRLGELLFAKTKLQTSFVEFPDHAEVLGYRARHSTIQRALIAPVRLVSKTPLAWPVVYAGVAIGALALAIRRRARIAVMLATSGLLWELGAAFFATNAERKHSHWLVVTAVLAACVVLWHREDRAHGALEVDADRAAVPVE